MMLKSKIICSTFIVMGFISLVFNASLLRAEVKPGDVIDASNCEKAADVLPFPLKIAEFMKRDGLVMKVIAPKNYPHPAAFVEATKKNAGTCKLEDNCMGYIAGQPFPEIDEKDPKAALKIAWNNAYRFEGEQNWYKQMWFDFINKDGVIERQLLGKHAKCRVQGRVVLPTVPNQEKVLRKEYMQFIQPKDCAGVGFIDIRYMADEKDDDMWAYVPALRRVRRMSGAQRQDAYMSSDFHIEDFYGFSGKVSDYTWKLIGRKKILAPRDVPWKFPHNYGPKWHIGKDVEYQPRDHWVVEIAPVSKAHPYSKRILYIDCEWYETTYAESYDKKGEAWNYWVVPSTWVPERQWFVCPMTPCIDVQANHGSVAVVAPAVVDDIHVPSWFTLDALEKGGH